MIQNQSLTLREQIALQMKSNVTTGPKDDWCRLSDCLLLGVGLKVMVTHNISTTHQIANRAWGEIVRIILDPCEDPKEQDGAQDVELSYPPACVLIQLNSYGLMSIQDLDPGVIPIFLIDQSFQISMQSASEGETKTKMVKWCQLPLTESYALTDYQSQGQTIPHIIVDIGAVSYGKLMPFNVYIALSHSSGWESIHLLQDFDDSLFTSTPCTVLEEEDKWLEKLDHETYDAWKRDEKWVWLATIWMWFWQWWQTWLYLKHRW